MKIGPRVLILYITEHSGHHSAARSLQKALQDINQTAVVSCVNAFRHAFPFAERMIHAIYITVIKRTPGIWEAMYDNPLLLNRSQGIKRWVHALGIKRLKGLIESFQPNVVVCTQAFPCGIVADYKAACGSRLPLIGVLTDLAPHSFWVYDQVDRYVVHCAESQKLLAEKEVPEEKISALGIPIDPKFATPLDRREILANYGLKSEVPVVMVMGGGRGLGSMRDILRQLDQSEKELQLIAVCGLNKRLYQWTQRASFRKRVLAFRFTDQVDRLMTAASLLITKPGGITTAEALAKRLPMIVVDPIPGQEARNTQLLIENGLAAKVVCAAEVPAAVETMLKRGEGGGGAGFFPAPIRRFSKPDSSRDIAALALDLC